MDRLSKLNLKTDTSIALIKSGMKSGIDIWISEPQDLSICENRIYTSAVNVIDENFKKKKKEEIQLEKFDFFFIRQDPPFNMNYLSNCYLLEIHKKNFKKPFFINDPSGIKNLTEKIFPLYFHEYMPKTMITADKRQFLKFLKKYKTVVIKPLYLKGGEGIEKVSCDKSNALRTFNTILRNFKSPLVIQKFIEKVELGDKRVILIDGYPYGVLNRVPKKGEFKANLHLGGKAEKSTLTKKEQDICKELKPILKKNKLFLVGIDLIGEKLTEINVTSPTGINQINLLYNLDLGSTVWEILKKKHSISNNAI